MHVGLSTGHIGMTPLVLNPETGSITAQHQVVFDDWFATVSLAESDMPDFGSDEWKQLFGPDSIFSCDFDNDNSQDQAEEQLRLWRE